MAMTANEKLMNSSGLVAEYLHVPSTVNPLVPPTGGTTVGQFNMIIGCIRAFQATGNVIAKELAERALSHVLSTVFNGLPVPDAVTETVSFTPNWLFNVKEAITGTDGSSIAVDQPMDNWPVVNIKALRPSEMVTSGETYNLAETAFTLAATVFGGDTWSKAAAAIRAEFRLVTQRPILAGSPTYARGIIPYRVLFRGPPTAMTAWRGPFYIGQQDPNFWAKLAHKTEATRTVQMLDDAQVAWRTLTGQPGLGPFAPVYYLDHGESASYGTPGTFGWAGPEPTFRGNARFLYLAISNLIFMSDRYVSTDPLVLQAVRVVKEFIYWLAQDWAWLPEYAPHVNMFSQVIEMSIAQAWMPPITPIYVDAWTAAIGTGTALGYGIDDVNVPLLPAPNLTAGNYPWTPVVVWPTSPPLGPPTHYPQGAHQTDYPDPDMTALILRALVKLDRFQRPLGNTTGPMNVQLRAVMSKGIALLDRMYIETGDMAGSFSRLPLQHEWFGAWHGEILLALTEVMQWATNTNVARPSIATLCQKWIAGMLRFGKANTDPVPSPFGQFLWRLRHNWASPVAEEFVFATEIVTAFTGKEQRTSLRRDIRRRLTLRHSLSQNEMRAYDAMLRTRQNLPMLIPQWHLAYETIAPTVAGQNYVDIDTLDTQDLRWGAPAVLNAGRMLLEVKIESVDGTRVYFDFPLDDAWPPGTKLAPCYNAFAASSVSGSRETSSVIESSMVFQMMPQEDGRYIPTIAAPKTFTVGADVREVMLRKPNFASPLGAGYAWEMNLSEGAVGPIIPVSGPDSGVKSMQVRWTLKNRGEVNDFVGFLKRCAGRRWAFWLPSWTQDFLQTRPIAETDRLYVSTNMLLEVNVFADSCTAILVRYANGTSSPARVNNIVYGANECVLLLDRVIPATTTLGAVLAINMLHRVRQASDTATITWRTSEVAEAVMNYMTVYDEL